MEIREEIYHLCLDRDVQRRYGFVEDDELGLNRQCPRNADPLLLAARQFMRIPSGEARIEANLPEQLVDSSVRVLTTCDAVHLQGLTNGCANRHSRVQRPGGILKHDLHPAPQSTHVGPAQGEDVYPVERDPTGSRFDEPHDTTSQSGLAAATFPYQCQGLTAWERKTDAVYGADVIPPPEQAAGRKVLHEVLDSQQSLGGAHRA